MLDDKHMPDHASFAADLDAQIAEMDAPDDDLSGYVQASPVTARLLTPSARSCGLSCRSMP